MLLETQAPHTNSYTEEGAPVENAASPGPLFIVGMPRSGTKLLRGLLNQHPRVRVPDIETDFFPFLVRWVRENGRPDSEAAFARLFEALSGATYFAFRRPDAIFSRRAWRSHCRGRYDAAGLFEGFIRYEVDAPSSSDIIWGDKSPAHIRHIGLLLEHFQDARVVHIVRDVRDYCVSIRKAWNKDVRRAAFQWGRDVAAAHRLCLADPAHCIEIRYEELLRSPEAEMRRLCRFLDIGFSDAMLRLQQPAENRGDATGSVEIVRNNSRKFADQLTHREIAGIESLALNTMRVLDYQPLYAERQRSLSSVEQRLRRIKDGVQLVLHGARTRGFANAFRFYLSHLRVTRQ